MAIERGPLVYCAEAIDNGGHALDAVLPDDAPLTVTFVPDLLGGVTVIHSTDQAHPLQLIPYYAWAHRGIGEMTVWLRRS